MELRSFLFYMIIVLMGLTLLSVIFGLIQSIRGTRKSSIHAQRAMKARVFFQGIAIALFGFLIYINKG